MSAPEVADNVRDLRNANARRATLRVVNQIGMELFVEVASIDDAYAAMRQFGARGWSSGAEIPRGGYTLPYAMHETFDWSLIGAKHVTFRDGEGEGVYYRGDLYKRRDFGEEKKHGKTMPPKVKYSRGGQPTDDPTMCEGANDTIKFGYVTLITFVGGGKAITSLCRPEHNSGQALPTQRGAENREEVGPPSDRQRAQIRTSALAREIALESDRMKELVRSVSATGSTKLESLDAREAETLIAALNALPLPSAYPADQERPPATHNAALHGSGGLLADGVVTNLERAIERAKLSETEASDLIASVSLEIDGETTYELRRLSMRSVNVFLQRLKGRTHG